MRTHLILHCLLIGWGWLGLEGFPVCPAGNAVQHPVTVRTDGCENVLQTKIMVANKKKCADAYVLLLILSQFFCYQESCYKSPFPESCFCKSAAAVFKQSFHYWMMRTLQRQSFLMVPSLFLHTATQSLQINQ